MLGRIKELFARPEGTQPSAEESEERLRIATCVLLLEVARVDEEFSDEERQHIIETLSRRFSLSESEAQELVDAASASRKESVDLWSFTRQINEACSVEEKEHVIEEVWRVIYADGTLDAHEDWLAHKLAKLLNLTHPQLIRAKVKVLDESRDGE